MPEGPEVETIRLGLLDVTNKEIIASKVANHKMVTPIKNKVHQLKGYQVDRIERKAKFLVWHFTKGNEHKIGINHLGMTGVWYYFSDTTWNKIHKPFETYKHYKLYFRLEDNTHLLFVNIRTFGRFEIINADELDDYPAFRNLGPDILEIPFNIDEFVKRVRGKNGKRYKEIGKCLLDPTIVTGCGNIYKSEALFLARINPFSQVVDVKTKDLIELGVSLSKVAKLAMKHKGSTLRDYRHVDGYSGLMQNQFKVYDRAGENCTICENEVLSARQGDRTSFWCEICQPLKITRQEE